MFGDLDTGRGERLTSVVAERRSVVAVQTTEDGRPHLACLSARPFTNAAVENFIAAGLALPLTVVSDGLGCFTVAASMGAATPRLPERGITVAEFHR